MSDAAALLRDLTGAQARLVFAQAVALARRGSYAEAEDCLRFVLEHEPSADAHCLVGKVCGQQTRYDAAQAAFERALTLDPTHADAGEGLVCVKALARSGPAAAWRAWPRVGAAAAMIGLVAVTTLVGVRPGRHVMPSDPVVAVTAASDVGSINPHAAELMRAFGALTTTLQPLRSLTDVTLHPTVAGGAPVVAVRGTVPSDHLRAELTRVLGLGAGILKVDTTGVQVTGRYTVRKADTFSSIAAALCGRAALFTALQALNREAVPTRLRPGSSIVVSCQ